MTGTATSIQFGDGLNVTDEGSGAIRVDACVTVTKKIMACWSGNLPSVTGNGYVWRVPFNANGTSFSFLFTIAFMRLETTPDSPTQVRIEKSPSGGAFTPTAITTLAVTPGNYENQITGLSVSGNSGDLLRIVFVAVPVTSSVYQVELTGSE